MMRDKLALARAHVRQVVDRSGTSFRWSMKALPPDQRQAIYAVYAFCREVDDVVDEPGEVKAKADALAAWRAEIEAVYGGSPALSTGLAIADSLKTFALPKAAFLDVIDGMKMDLDGVMRAPSEADLYRYCDRVAGAVGRLSLSIFGSTGDKAHSLAAALGEALQYTNILRDLGEDMRLNRLYLPRENLVKHGIESDDPAIVLAHPNIGAVCDELARHARQRFGESTALIAQGDTKRLKSCRVMIAVYQRILDGLEARGWGNPTAPFHLSKPTKAWIALRYGIF